MTYILAAFGLYALLFIFGFPVALLTLRRRHAGVAFALAPLAGYSLLVYVIYAAYRLDLPGTDSYARALPALAVVLWLWAGWVWRGRRIDWRPIARCWGGAALLTAAALIVTSVVFMTPDGKPFSFSLANGDVPYLSFINRFLMEFPRSGGSGHFLEINQLALSDDRMSGGGAVTHSDSIWFGPSAIVAFVCSLLGKDVHRLQSLTLAVVAAQGAPMIWLMATYGLRLPRLLGLAAGLVYALNPVIIYVVWEGWNGAMVTTPLVLAVLFVHLLAVRRPSLAGYLRTAGPILLVLLSGIVLSYHFMVVATVALMLGHTATMAVLRRRLAEPAGVMAAIVALFAGALAVNAVRVWSVVTYLPRLHAGDENAFILWLSPERQLGIDAGDVFLKLGASGDRLPVLAAIAGLAVWLAVLAWRNRLPAPVREYLVGLWLPTFAVGLLFAVVEMRGGMLGGYKGFKLTSSFVGLTLVAVLLPFGLARLSRPRLRLGLGLALLAAVAAEDVRNLRAIYGWSRAYSFILPADFNALAQVESRSDVPGIVIEDKDPALYQFWIWVQYFCARKPQFIYSLVSKDIVKDRLEADFDPRLNEYFRVASTYRFNVNPFAARADMKEVLEVDRLGYADRIGITPSLWLYRVPRTEDLRIAAAEGWWDAEATHRWSGRAGRTAVLDLYSPEDTRASLRAEYLPLRPGDGVTLRVNDQPVALEAGSEALRSVEFPVRAGRNRVVLESRLEPGGPSPWDGRTLMIAWKSITLVPHPAGSFGRRLPEPQAPERR